MRVTFLGQAGLFIETRAGSILCDPWFSPAYFGSWLPFPANDDVDPATLQKPTYLYISHLHHDHFDPAWLTAHVDRGTTVILPDYPIGDLRRELHRIGFRRFIETADLEPVDLGGGLRIMVKALTAPTDGPIGDSALLVDDGETRLLNLNDSRPTDPDQMLALGPIDLLFLQFSGAIWYPMVYELPAKAKATLAHKKRVAQLARSHRYIQIVDPAFVVPSAGPPCFLDDELFEQNDLHDDPTNIFPDQTVFLHYLEERDVTGARLMLPGSVGDLRPGSFEIVHPVPDAEITRIFDDREGYLREYQVRVRPILDAEHARWEGERVDLLAELRPWFEPLMAMADHVSSGIGDRILLDVGDEGVVLDFVDRVVRPWDGEEACRYRFWVDRRLVETLVREREVDWVNSLFLSMRFRASRKGQYNDYVYTWFKCLDVERIQYAEGFYAEKAKSEGTFPLGGWEIQRRCPHMKADLTRFATVDDGILTCQLHGWQFDLATGVCLTSADHPVEARRLTEEEIAALSAGAEAAGAGVASPD